VQALIPFDTEDDAVRIANGTAYGLVAGVWTESGGGRCAGARPAGGAGVRQQLRRGGGVELPFGGSRLSGHGREKGIEALYGFSAVKTVAAWHG
jgi:aldehyde dehydrogenase (NAD+)